MRILIYLVLFFLLSSCHNVQNKYSSQKLQKEKSLIQLSDSSYFSDIRSICFSKNKFFVSEYNRDNIFILNHNLQLEKTLGNKGKGPGELLGASHMFIYRDSIFVINDSHRTIEVFNFKKYLTTIKFPPAFEISSDIRFCVNQRKILLTNFNFDSSMSMLYLDYDSLVWFGNYKNFGTPKETRIKNKRHIQIIKDKIIALSDCLPVMELYNMKGELINIFDLRGIDVIDNLIIFTDKQKKTESSYYQMFPDFYIDGNQIFFLTLSVNKNNKLQCNTILHFELVDNSIVHRNIFRLDDGWYGPFCVNEKKILIFNQTNTELTLYNYE